MFKPTRGLAVAVVAVLALAACSGQGASASGTPVPASPTPEATPTASPSASPNPTPAATASPGPAGADIRVVKQDTEFVKVSGNGDYIHGEAVIRFRLTLQNDGDVAARASCDFTISDSSSALADSPFVNTEHRRSTLKPIIEPGQTVNATYTFDGAPVELIGANVSWDYDATCEAAAAG